jgi:hypothetical protein
MTGHRHLFLLVAAVLTCFRMACPPASAENQAKR